ncbi:MAG TPA: FAD-binding protein, partial [Euzebya sp.]|nr:FAD-binding protein [Euzebya sp.]
MRSYGQFCPIARASEILAERWTLIILRNLLYGCTTFGELAAGAPGISRSLLSTRLRELERSGVVDVVPKPDGNGSTYQLTAAGRGLWAVLGAMGDWGVRWLELAPATASPDVVLWSWATAYLERDRLPAGRVVVRFDFPDQPAPRRRLWLLVEHGDAEVCHKPPGFDEDLVVLVEDARSLALWHMGLLEWYDALRAGRIQVTGPRPLARALPTWNRRRRPAPQARLSDAPPPAGPPAARPRATQIPGFTGVLLRPGEEGYEAGRRVWNGAIDRSPAYIASCQNAADVVAALRFARERELVVAVRGGGHGVAGTAVCDDGVVIDLSAMRDVEVKPARRTSRAGAGVVWGELDAATQAFGLATTGGVVSHTGVAGLTLGGGIGWLMRHAGLTIDNLLEAEVVTAAGDVLTASEEENADLFWALRGGGGNFGVVTSFDYRLHAIGPAVLAGPVLWPIEQAPDILRAYRDIVQQAPRELATIVTLRQAAPLPLLPIELHRRPVCMITMCCTGDLERAETVLAPLRGLGRPLIDLVDVRPYTALQSMVDATVPHGWHYYWKTANFRGLADDLIDTLVEHASRIRWTWPYAVMFHLGGAVSDVAEDATAFPHRRVAHSLNINAVWLPDDADGDDQIAWTRAFHDAVQPHQNGAYLNFLDHDDHDQVRAALGDPAYQRLAVLKDRYDP